MALQATDLHGLFYTVARRAESTEQPARGNGFVSKQESQPVKMATCSFWFFFISSSDIPNSMRCSLLCSGPTAAREANHRFQAINHSGPLVLLRMPLCLCKGTADGVRPGPAAISARPGRPGEQTTNPSNNRSAPPLLFCHSSS